MRRTRAKMKLRTFVVIGIGAVLAFSGQARGVNEEEEPSLGQKIKRFFIRPSPTPQKKLHKKASPTPKKERPKRSPSPNPSPSALPSASPSETDSRSSPSETISPEPSPTATPESTSTITIEPATPSAAPSRPPSAQHTEIFEPVRPISPPPRRRVQKQPSPTGEETALPRPKETPLPKAAASASPKKGNAAVATISTSEIAGYENYPAEVRQILDLGLSLTTQNLGYKYNSADPTNGGMDCSGFIYYVLSKTGIKDVPRDAREQYIWVRKAGTFQAVLAQRDDTFELDALKPGDLLFWAAAYGVNRDPEVTHTMIYLGREKATDQRIMVGASDGRIYKGHPRFGVSVFDFKVGRAHPKKANEPGPMFVGYAPLPGLRGE